MYRIFYSSLGSWLGARHSAMLSVQSFQTCSFAKPRSLRIPPSSPCMYACTCAQNTCMHTCSHTPHARARRIEHMCMRACTDPHPRLHSHPHAHVHARAYTQTHARTHTNGTIAALPCPRPTTATQHTAHNTAAEGTTFSTEGGARPACSPASLGRLRTWP